MEDKEDNQDYDDNNTTTNTNIITTTSVKEVEECIRRGGGGVIIGGDRVKRDEWSEGAVSSLLEAYEAKWVLRNRAKLKGQDWEDVARFVSLRANSTKSPKTQTQCKNKIESMKKRYRSESATTADASTWPLYSRLDVLLRGTGTTLSALPLPLPLPSTTTTIATPSHQSPRPCNNNNNNQGLMLLEPSLAVSHSQAATYQQPLPAAPTQPPAAAAQNSYGSTGVDRLAKEDALGTKSSDHVSNKNPLDTDSSTPALYSEKDKLRCNKRKMKMESNKRQRNKEHMEIAESIRWLAEVVVRSEQTRMDTMKEIERMRVEAEAKRGEMDLKRTEIIANTQLEIARIFASVNKGGGVDSSLRIGRS